MTDYIIDPAIFYWMNAMNMLRSTCLAIGITLIVACSAFIISALYNYTQVVYYQRTKCLGCEEQYKRYFHTCKKGAIITGVVGTVLIIGLIFSPDKSTSIEMLIAKTATYSNAEWTVDKIKEAVNYIVAAFNTIR